MPPPALEAVRADITRQDTDAIVNAANAQLSHGAGVAAAIAAAAGPDLQRESREHPPIPVGGAGWTTAGVLPARWVIHAVGPIWSGGDEGEADLLASAYRSAITVAGELGAKSIAFPSISTGVFGYPVAGAAEVAAGVLIDAAPRAGLELIRLCLFSDTDLAAYRDALERNLTN